jgi:hypothetical protein
MNIPRALAGVLFVSLAVSACFPVPVAAVPLHIFPTDDDRGLDALLDGNFLCCQLDSGQATVTLTTFEERAALEFGLAGVPVDAVVASATLTLSVPVAPLAVNTIAVHGYAGDGVITVADLTLENLLTTFQVNAAGSAVIPIDPSFIQDLLIGNETFAGFALRNVTDPSGVFTFYTVDSGFEQFNPILTLDVDSVQAVPEPGSIVLVGVALAAWRVRRRFRRRCPSAR